MKPTLQSIFRESFEVFSRTRRLSQHHRKAAQSIIECRPRWVVMFRDARYSCSGFVLVYEHEPQPRVTITARLATILTWTFLTGLKTRLFNVRGLLRRKPDLNIVRLQDVGLSGTDDSTVLEWAAQDCYDLLLSFIWRKRDLDQLPYIWG